MPSCALMKKFLPSFFKRKAKSKAHPTTKEKNISRSYNEKSITPRPATSASNATTPSLRARARELRNSAGLEIGSSIGRRASRSSFKKTAKTKPAFEDHAVYIMLYKSQREENVEGDTQPNVNTEVQQQRQFSNASSVYEEDLVADAAAAARANAKNYDWGIYISLQTGDRQRQSIYRDGESDRSGPARPRSSFSSIVGSLRGKDRRSISQREKPSRYSYPPTLPKQTQSTSFGRLWRLVESDTASIRPISSWSSYSRPISSAPLRDAPTLPAVPVQTYNTSSFLTPPQPTSSKKPTNSAANSRSDTAATSENNMGWRVKKLSSKNIPADPNLLLAAKIGYVPRGYTRDFEIAASNMHVPDYTGPKKSATHSPVPEHLSSIKMVRQQLDDTEMDDDYGHQRVDNFELSASGEWVNITLSCLLADDFHVWGRLTGARRREEKDFNVRQIMETMLQTHELNQREGKEQEPASEEKREVMILRADAHIISAS